MDELDRSPGCNRSYSAHPAVRLDAWPGQSRRPKVGYERGIFQDPWQRALAASSLSGTCLCRPSRLRRNGRRTTVLQSARGTNKADLLWLPLSLPDPPAIVGITSGI